MTTVYLIRHSEPFKVHRGMEELEDDLLTTNKKTPLSVNGEKLAEQVSMNLEFNNIDVIWSSDYVRAMSTAKYFADKNNLKVNVSYRLGERKHGINDWSELPPLFEKTQMEDENYKLENGESQKEVRERIKSKLLEIINDNKDKRIIIVGHSTAFAFLLKEWCNINYEGPYLFNNKEFFDGNFKLCETFKLIFENNNLISIENIKL